MLDAKFRQLDGTLVEVRIQRQGRKNSRVVFSDGHDELVPSVLLEVVPSSAAIPTASGADPRRIVPLTPLRQFYRELRKLRGTPQELYEGLISRVAPLHGPPPASFLAELFARSCAAMEFYRNEDTGFYQRGRRAEARATNRDARRLVDFISDGLVAFEPGCPQFEYVDYEICPTQTVLSCLETGKPATRSGSGGMDLLLLSTAPAAPIAEWAPLPAVGEIKAATESVGPTFALVQSLVYAAEMVSRCQWTRFGRSFELLQGICTAARQPQVDVIILLQIQTRQRPAVTADLECGKQLARQLVEDRRVAHAIRNIEFVSWRLENEQAVLFLT